MGQPVVGGVVRSHRFDGTTVGQESPLSLLAQAQAGDPVATEALLGRYLVRLQRWASGRVPSSVRGLLDTDQAGGGFLRMETASNTYTGSVSGPPAGGSFISFPTAPIPSNLPVLRITSVGGITTPTNPQAALASPDVTFETPIESPVTLQVTANNVPVGTTVNIRVVPAVGSPTTATTTPLAGTNASSTADATVTLPPGAGVITASASFNVSSGQIAGLLPAALPLIDGERPTRVEVVAEADGGSRTFLVAKSGVRFELGRRSASGLQ